MGWAYDQLLETPFRREKKVRGKIHCRRIKKEQIISKVIHLFTHSPFMGLVEKLPEES